MKNIGEAFAFYVKHCSEMEALYVEEDYELLPEDQKPKRNEIEAKINRIGDLACEEVADFLTKGAEIIIKRLEGKVGVAKLTKRPTMVSNWHVEVQVWPKEIKSKPRDWNHTIGIGLKNAEDNIELIIWSWVKNNITFPDRVIQKYKGLFPHAINPYPQLDKKTIVWELIKIKLNQDKEELFVDEEALLKVVQDTINKFIENLLKSFLQGYP